MGGSRQMRSNYGTKPKVLIKTPHFQSLGSLLKLQDFLALQDPDPKDLSRSNWLKFRQKLLQTWLNERGVLECHYCGKGPLMVETNSSNPFCATLDHKKPRAKGGAECDLNNLVVACPRCNTNKKDIPYLTYMLRIGKIPTSDATRTN